MISPTLSDGYYKDEIKTKKCFVNVPGKPYLYQMYKTGDIGYYDKNGNIVYKCRVDFQIKHMGHRIELFEIETFSNAILEIDESACVYDSLKSKIILFYTLKKGLDIQNADIILKLKQKLPAYMIPNKLIQLESMPKNANGKIDRVGLKNMV